MECLGGDRSQRPQCRYGDERVFLDDDDDTVQLR
jgi:hypothetical protein